MMTKSLVVSALLVSTTAFPAAAQVNDAVSKACSTRPGQVHAACLLGGQGKQFNVSSGYTYLKSAITGKQDPAAAGVGQPRDHRGDRHGRPGQGGVGGTARWVDLFQGDGWCRHGAGTRRSTGPRLQGGDRQAAAHRIPPIANSGECTAGW
jgi:hypothetical protein